MYTACESIMISGGIEPATAETTWGNVKTLDQRL